MLVMVNGVFDILHAGHVFHLEQARMLGSSLLVALTKDEFVNKGPGRPVNPWNARATVLMGLRCVNTVVESQGAVDSILKVKPQVFVKGIDYVNNSVWTEDILAACKEVGAVLAFTTTNKESSSNIIRRINELSSHR